MVKLLTLMFFGVVAHADAVNIHSQPQYLYQETTVADYWCYRHQLSERYDLQQTYLAARPLNLGSLTHYVYYQLETDGAAEYIKVCQNKKSDFYMVFDLIDAPGGVERGVLVWTQPAGEHVAEVVFPYQDFDNSDVIGVANIEGSRIRGDARAVLRVTWAEDTIITPPPWSDIPAPPTVSKLLFSLDYKTSGSVAIPWQIVFDE